jgi:acyl carrier protein
MAQAIDSCRHLPSPKPQNDLSEEFGLELLDIIELTILLEEQVDAEGEVTNEPNQIEFVGDLIRHIERQSIESHREETVNPAAWNRQKPPASRAKAP